MDDSQLERELAALAGTQAEPEQKSEAEPEKPEKPVTTPGEGEEGQAETETDDADAEQDDDAGDDASEPDEDGEGEKDEAPKRKKSGISRLKERNAALQAEVAALRSRASDSEPTQAEVEKLIGKPPKEDDFKGDFLAYERAQTVYEMRKANAEDRIRDQAVQAKDARTRAKAETVEAHNERVEEFREKVPDFDKTLRAAGHLKASPTVEDLILESEKSAHLVYHLAKRPDVLANLNRMSEREAAREIGRIEARLSLPSPKTQTKAPAPKVPPKGGSTPSSPDKELDGWLKKTYGS
jgi:hypothetical protein